MARAEWQEEFPGSILVCDRDGVILEMNAMARENTAKEGGAALIGTNALDCHPEPARSKLAKLLAEGGRNVYTIEKKGKRKLVYQSPWYENDELMGLVELSLEIPETMPHHVRSPI